MSQAVIDAIEKELKELVTECEQVDRHRKYSKNPAGDIDALILNRLGQSLKHIVHNLRTDTKWTR